MKELLTALCLFFFNTVLMGQSINIELTDYSSYLYERQMILNGKGGEVFLNLKPYDRLDMARRIYAMSKDTSHLELDYILDENEMFLYRIFSEEKDSGDFSLNKSAEEPLRTHDKAFLRYFYRTPAQFFQLGNVGKDGNYRFRLNPIVHFAMGTERGGLAPFVNQRGLQIDLSLSNKLYVSADILETQVRYPSYITRYIGKYGAVPENGFYKGYKSSIINSEGAYDFLNSKGKLGFNIIPEVALEFGYGKNELGDGIRSLILSDFSDNYLFLNLNTRIGRLVYRNTFAEIRGSRRDRDPDTRLVPKKYFAMHYLGFKVLDNLQLGVFENVVFSRDDGFELHYLNPIILYRTIEVAIGDPDNIIMGIDARWDILRQYSLYGNIVFDEFKAKELIFNNQKWWANKYAVQVGAKAYDFLKVPGLDIIAEMNFIRPFMYSHKFQGRAWVHYDQNLAHPRGANLREFLFDIRYRPTLKWDFSLTGMIFSQGLSPDGENYGENPHISYDTRSHDYGNNLLQGVRDDVLLTRARISYMLWHGASLDLIGQRRTSTVEDNSTYLSVGFRWNASSLPYLF